MPRPPKKTLDFFLHDANARSDRKIKGLRRRHGNDGYAAYFILLEMLCQEDGMQLRLSDPLDTETAIEETGVRDQAHLHAIIQTCADINLFDKQLWESERVVFSHGLYKRYKSRLEERRADAQRKQRKREEAALQKRIEEIESQHEPKIQNPESETKAESEPDPNPEPKHPALSESCPTGQLTDEGGERVDFSRSEPTEQGTALPPARPLRPLADPTAATFWEKPWRDAANQLSPEFCEYVGDLFPGDSNKHPRAKGRNHIINLERSGDPSNFEKLNGYWDDYQTRQATPPDQAIARNAITAQQAITAELARQHIAQELAS